MDIKEVLKSVEQYRLQDNFKDAYDLLAPLVVKESSNAFVHLEMGLTYDAMGKEVEAIPYYERALSIGLPFEERCVAMLCLGSSYRNVGDVEKARQILAKAIDEFPDHIGLRCFYSLAQFSAGEAGKAVGTLMDAILHISPETVKPFYKGLLHYRQELK
jgi:tetratricopeptide (TPR) repeat protein